jgi:tetratricopeptide (TPR) repeat protein
VYESSAGGIFNRMGEASRDISQAVGVRPTALESERLASDRDVSAEAYELYVKASATGSSLSAATCVAYLEQAIAMEPFWAAAHAALLQVYVHMRNESQDPVPDLDAKIEATRARVLQLDPFNADVNTALAWEAIYRRDWAEVSSRLERAFDARPNDFMVLAGFAQAALCLARLDEAISYGKELQRIAPTDPSAYWGTGGVYFYTREYEVALEWFEEAVTLAPEVSFAWRGTGLLHGFLGRYDLAIEHLQRAMELDPSDTTLYACMALVYRLKGDRGGVLRWLDALKARYQGAGRQAYDIAGIYALMGEPDEAFRWIEEQYRLNDSALYFMHMDQQMDPLRSDPRYHEMLRRLNLPEFTPPRNLQILPPFDAEGSRP